MFILEIAHSSMNYFIIKSGLLIKYIFHHIDLLISSQHFNMARTETKTIIKP